MWNLTALHAGFLLSAWASEAHARHWVGQVSPCASGHACGGHPTNTEWCPWLGELATSSPAMGAGGLHCVQFQAHVSSCGSVGMKVHVSPGSAPGGRLWVTW